MQTGGSLIIIARLLKRYVVHAVTMSFQVIATLPQFIRLC